MSTEVQSSQELRCQIGQSSRQGIRDINEDTCVVHQPTSADTLNYKGILAIIADGVGGTGDGREASQHICNTLVSLYYNTPDSWSVERSLSHALDPVNNRLYKLNMEMHQRSLVSTCTALILHGQKAFVMHIGDTRLYRWRANRLECLTVDHCLPNQPDQLIRMVGLDSKPNAESFNYWVEPGDVYILTTDGVHRAIEEQNFVQCLSEMNNPQECAEKITRQALIDCAHGDNATCQVICIEQLPPQSRTEASEEVQDLIFPDYLEPGDTLDHFLIKSEISSGGMGTIYLAENQENKSLVAIKCPNPDYQDNPIFLERFLREEWVGRRLHSQYLMKMNPPKKREKYLYLAMEYCQGQNLRQIMEKKLKYNLDEIIHIFQQIGMGLNFLHNLNIIHRDIKPDNIVVSAENSVKIVDFGIVLIPDLSDLSEQSELVGWFGSPHYMAPELFEESRGSMQSDIFALGVTMYEALTGHYPYGEIDPISQYKDRLYNSVLNYRKELPDWLDALIEKCVALNPDERFGAVSEFNHFLHHPGDVTIQGEKRLPLIEENPLIFWKYLCCFLCSVIFFLIYLLIRIS